MARSAKEILRRLGAGEAIDAVRAAAGMTRAEFDAWWRAETAARVPAPEATTTARITTRLVPSPPWDRSAIMPV